VEDLQQAVFGAGLDAVQLSRGPVNGSLAFASRDRMIFSTGLIRGRVSLTGPLSPTMTTLGIGIIIPPGSRHWKADVETGGVGIFRGGDTHEAIYYPGSIYACVSLEDDLLEEVAADKGLVLDARQLGGSRIMPQLLCEAALARLGRGFHRVHGGAADDLQDAAFLGMMMLDALVEHVAREPLAKANWRNAGQHCRIVDRAQQYILANLTTRLAISGIASAACTSQTTLYRAFHEVLDETPQSFIRKLRLNRIRRDLISEEEARCSITLLANKWGVAELGRFAAWYRGLFGELPSETRLRRMKGRDFPFETDFRH